MPPTGQLSNFHRKGTALREKIRDVQFHDPPKALWAGGFSVHIEPTRLTVLAARRSFPCGVPFLTASGRGGAFAEDEAPEETIAGHGLARQSFLKMFRDSPAGIFLKVLGTDD
jgi:hypothetical protein